jgi:uncharacterized membrane-anchored protein YitT (DUF2179 family)
MKTGIIISTALFVIGVLLSLIQLWFSPWDRILFDKIIFSIGGLFIVTLVVSFVYKEYKENKKLKDGGDLD